jgi:hypothetical protein
VLFGLLTFWATRAQYFNFHDFLLSNTQPGRAGKVKSDLKFEVI